MHRRHILGATVLAAALAGCAGMGAAPDDGLTLEQRLAGQGYRQGEAVERIPGFGLSGWSYVDEYHILIENGPRDEYLLTFSMACRELEYVNTIAHTSTVGSLARLDRVMAREMGRPVVCPIREIHKVERVPKAAG